MPMITAVQISRFRCLEHVEVPLGPLAVLIGKNDTGKTSFLDAIRWALGETKQAEWDPTLGSNGEAVVRVVLDTGETVQRRSESAARGARHALTAQGTYRLRADKLTQAVSPGHLEQGALAPDGEGLPDVVFRLSNDERQELRGALSERVPFVHDFRQVGVDGRIGIEIQVRPSGGWLPLSAASEGVILIFGYLALFFDNRSPQLLLIEEPENGLHPAQLRYVLSLFTRMSGAGPERQVIMTTHSPLLLDAVPPEAIRVFTRSDAGTRVHNFADLDKVKALLGEGFTVGEVWFNGDEEELLPDPQ
jgi:predicted ATPase